MPEIYASFATMCNECSANLLDEEGKLKAPIQGKDLKRPGETKACNFCGRDIEKNESATLMAIHTMHNPVQ